MLSVQFIHASLDDAGQRKEENRILFLERENEISVKIYEDKLKENSAIFQRFLREQFPEIANDIRSSLLDLLECIEKKDVTGDIATIQGGVIGRIKIWVGYESDFLPDFDPYKNIAQPQ
jgi:hypothetical protein